MTWEGLLLSASFCTDKETEAQKGHSTVKQTDECPPGAETDPQPQAHTPHSLLDGHPDHSRESGGRGVGQAQATRDAVSVLSALPLREREAQALRNNRGPFAYCENCTGAARQQWE